ncbi:MAG: class I SAM-dependent methyltransferase [Planctomycetes bacterium]|nr:class I SAM-dependent methyltransferase [Planctomycetota bacterium]
MGDELTTEVRQAAEKLVSALEAARGWSDGWANETLSDALVDRALSECVAQLAITGCWGRDNQIPSGELWRIAGEWLQVGVLQERARTKPLGYAGDYQMLDWIIRWQCCEHPLGRFFDRFFQRQAAPEAVRARTLLAAGVIAADCLAHADGPYHVVSVGVGPGLDLAAAAEILPRERRSGLRFTLLDLDEAGLEFAAGQLYKHVSQSQVTVVRDNLFRLARNKRAAERMAGANFILCTGLFDYLDDASAPALLQLFWQSLAPGGRMLVGNFAPHCPTRAYMEWIGNWYLNYRTTEELAGLARSAGIPSASFSIVSERLGIDRFIEAVR